MEKFTPWYNRPFNARGALGGLLVGVGIGVIPAVLLGSGNSWWPVLLVWLGFAVVGVILGILFIKPVYQNTSAQTTDVITYKRFGTYLGIVLLLYAVSVTVNIWHDNKTSYGLSLILLLIGTVVRAYMRKLAKKSL